MDILHFVHPSVDGHLGRFHYLPIMNSTPVNICVQIFVWMYVLTSHGYISGNGIAGPYGNSIFNFLRYCQTIFPK